MSQPESELAEQADLQPGQRSLEVGRGTGNLSLALEQRQAEAEIVRLDPHPRARLQARRKASGA
jgi:ubiquinone/menaquinone biosynthesis C-methylase UbiE